MGKMIDAQSINVASTATNGTGIRRAFCGCIPSQSCPPGLAVMLVFASKRTFCLCRCSPHDEFTRMRGRRYCNSADRPPHSL
jgi:hypothetical protein